MPDAKSDGFVRGSSRSISHGLPSLPRVGWGLLDQGLSSATNFLGLLALAKYLSSSEFGAASVSAAIMTLIVGLGRAAVSEALLVSTETTSEVLGPASAAGFVLGVFAALPVALAAVVAGGSLQAALSVLAFSLPGLLAVDLMRYARFARNEHRAAVRLDALWLATTALGIVAVLWSGGSSLVLLIGAWLGGATVAALIELSFQKTIPWLRAGVRLLISKRSLSGPYLIEFISVSGFTQAGIYGLAAVAGVEAVGNVRASQLLYGPLVVLFAGLYPVLLPAATKREEFGESVRPVAVLLTGLSVLAALIVLVIAISIPDSVGRQLLGESWAGAQPLLIPAGAAFACSAIGSGAIVGLRAQRRQRQLARTRVLMAIPLLLFSLLGALLAGSEGFLVAVAAGSIAFSLVAWGQLLSFRSGTA